MVDDAMGIAIELQRVSSTTTYGIYTEGPNLTISDRGNQYCSRYFLQTL